MKTDIPKLYWLASYPKSGNTWLRVFLHNILSETDTPADINKLGVTDMASSRAVFDEWTGVKSSDLSTDEIDKLRPEAFRVMNREITEKQAFIKIHDSFIPPGFNTPIIPIDATAGVVYLIRNPCDVVVSYAYHLGLSIDKTIEIMSDTSHTLSEAKSGMLYQFRQNLGSWSSHVQSWMSAQDLNIHLVHYEDMVHNTFDVFSSIVDFLGIDKNESEIKAALKKSELKKLQEQEIEGGFDERPIKKESLFFRKGEPGNWREELTAEQQEQIIHDHGLMMRKFGYLNEKEEPVY